MAELFASGRIVDIVLIVTCLEGLVLIAMHRVTRRGPKPIDIAANLGAGMCLMLALGAALRGSDWPWIALWLGLSGAAHALDLRRRWRRA